MDIVLQGPIYKNTINTAQYYYIKPGQKLLLTVFHIFSPICPGHSNNSLNYESWVPRHVKNNYIDNSVKMVTQKCSPYFKNKSD